MKKSDFKIGQEVGLRIREYSDKARCIKNKNHTTMIIKGIVTNIGSKYITIKLIDKYSYGEIKFDIKNNFRQKTNFSSDYYLFATIEDAKRDYDYDEMSLECKKLFDNNTNLTFESLEQILKILKGTN